MKFFVFALMVFFIASNGWTQNKHYYKKGVFSVYWGWNRSAYTKSDITFKGEDFDFVLQDVKAKDRQSPFNAETYFYPSNITIPQYNFRLGYFINDKYQISFGADHMKYVMQQNQEVIIDGKIQNTNTVYDRSYQNDDIILSEDFLKFEHTDGLNYENIEIRRFDPLFVRNKMSFDLVSGVGLGVLVPKTNCTILNNSRYDEFHLAGYGFSGVLALNMTFFKYFFIQSELRAGGIHMPDIRITSNAVDRARQYFWYVQYNVVFGGNFTIHFNQNKTE